VKKRIIIILISCIIVSMLFLGISCKPEEEVAEEVAPAEEKVAAEEAPAEEEAPEEPTELTRVTWISPRGTIDVMDDVCYWVADEMGYFKELGIELIMEPGPMEAMSCTKFTAEGKADTGFPSPGVCTSSIDAGMDIIMVYNRMPQQIFNFAVKTDSDIETVYDIEGKSISLGSPGWQVIVDPMLVELGIDPKSVTYFTGGELWAQAVEAGEADVALNWEGYRALWDAIGLDFRYFLGTDFSGFPSNGEVIRKADLNDPERRQLWINFFKAVSMGQHFLRHNPRAGAQIAYNKLPVVKEQMGPKEALEFTQQLHWICTYGERELGGYGDMDLDEWEKYLDIIYKLGQTSRLLKVEEVVTNELIEEINDFDRARVERDAKEFVLDDTWKDVEVTGNW